MANGTLLSINLYMRMNQLGYTFDKKSFNNSFYCVSELVLPHILALLQDSK